MSFTGASLADGQLPGTTGNLYVPTGVKAIIKSINLHNTKATTETVVISLKRSGSSSRILARAVLEQDETMYVLSEGEVLVLSDDDTLEGDSTNASAVDYVVTGATE